MIMAALLMVKFIYWYTQCASLNRIVGKQEWGGVGAEGQQLLDQVRLPLPVLSRKNAAEYWLILESKTIPLILPVQNNHLNQT